MELADLEVEESVSLRIQFQTEVAEWERDLELVSLTAAPELRGQQELSVVVAEQLLGFRIRELARQVPVPVPVHHWNSPRVLQALVQRAERPGRNSLQQALCSRFLAELGQLRVPRQGLGSVLQRVQQVLLPSFPSAQVVLRRWGHHATRVCPPAGELGPRMDRRWMRSGS